MDLYSFNNKFYIFIKHFIIKNGFVEILFDFCKNFLIILFFYIFALILLKTFEKFVI